MGYDSRQCELFQAANAVVTHRAREVTTTLEIERLIRENAAVVCSVSGGKDGQAAAIATIRHLDRVGHRGPRLLIHADLGMVEWTESLPACKAQAEALGLELAVVGDPEKGLMQRWESRWDGNVQRYADLSTVTLIMPWSSSSLRFCTSEQKTHRLVAYMRRRFKGHVINVTGVRREESPARSRCTIADRVDQRSRPNAEFWNWRPIADYTVREVFDEIREAGQVPHEAYTTWKLTRVSCRFCIMQSLPDMRASVSNPDSLPLYRRMVELEAASGFAFQGARWLGDLAPEVLGDDLSDRLAAGKRRAEARRQVESRITKDLLFEKGWPTRMITDDEAELLAGVRRDIGALYGFDVRYVTAAHVKARYSELIAARAMKPDEMVAG